MAARYSPYYVNEGRYGGVGQSIGQLGQVFADMNDPSRNIAADQAGWQTRKLREDVQNSTEARGGRGQIADIISTMDPATMDPRQIISTGVRNNSYEPSKIGDLFEVMMGNVPGATDAQRAGARVGAGKVVAPNDAFSLPGQDAIATRNAGFDSTLQAEKATQSSNQLIRGKQFDVNNPGPLSRDQLLSDLFQTQGPEAADSARQVLYNQTGAGDSGAGGYSWLDAKRKAEIEGLISKEVNSVPLDLGLDGGAVPPELRSIIINGAMDLVENQGATPAAAVGKMLQQYQVKKEGESSMFSPSTWGNGDPRVGYTPPIAGATPQSGGLPTVISDEDYNALPPGAQFQDETGKTFRKP